MSGVKLTETEKQAFVDAYLAYREDGHTTQKNAYMQARAELSSAGKKIPTWWAFRKWLEKGLTPEMPEVPEEETPEKDVQDVSDVSDVSADPAGEEPAAGEESLREENRTLRRLLRIALAFAGNQDLNETADKLIPDLLPEE